MRQMAILGRGKVDPQVTRAAPSDKTLGLRVTPFMALLLGVTLLAVGLLLTMSAVAQERQQARTQQRDAAQVSASFSSYFERARSLDLLLSQDEAFAQSAQGVVDFDAANRALGNLEVLYPDAIGEACIINEQGVELARVTEGQRAPAAELSSNEAENPFFAPTFALGPGKVYQAPPYVSPDTGRWVISNSTWIRQADGSRLIVHFEVSLGSFAPYVSTSGVSSHVAVVNRGDGQILLKNRTDLPTTDRQARFPVTDWSKAFTTMSSTEGSTTIDGHPAAYQIIDRAAGNANNWYVVEWSTARASLVPVWAGVASTALGVLLGATALLVLRRQQKTLRTAARLDHLTGLANRKALEEALEEALAGARSSGESVAVLMLDLDGFKQVNDSLGHDKGDHVLREIARRLHANVFEYDTAARLGGDEFAVVLRHLRESEDVAAVGHRLRDALTLPIEIDGTARFVGVSVGATAHPDHGRTAEELLRGADAAMYRAKRDGEGVRVYDPGTLAGASASELAADLRLAIDDSKVELAFQPQLSLSTGEIVGAEALARWNRPGYGPVPPIEFIAVAEQTGLIRSLTSLTLRLALDEVQAWRMRGVHVPVSVNISGRVVADRFLPIEVSALLEQRGLAGDSLVLEITETAVISDREGAVEVLQRLRETGIRIELDDFGSGSASFGTLHDLPLDGLKIDGVLVGDKTSGGRRLLAATIESAQRLGLKVVAEAIEDGATLDLLRRLGCDTAQGYHIGRPMTPEAVRSRLGGEESLAAQASAGPPTAQ
jgi:diguanylate cyclase (GGDEF)-like protein